MIDHQTHSKILLNDAKMGSFIVKEANAAVCFSLCGHKVQEDVL